LRLFIAVVLAAHAGIRITPSVYSTLVEIDYFVSAVEKELKNN